MSEGRRRRSFGGFEPIPPPIAERYLQACYVAINALLDILMAEHGAEWEIGKAVEQIVTMFPDIPGLRKALGDYAAGVGGLASSQAAQSTLFLLTQIAQLTETLNKAREDIADLKMIVRDNREQLTEIHQGLVDLREERREAGDHLQEQINELKERTR